ncbi:hypothetical protein F0L74_14180 [Chitinophaga agrisoli]|uniref:DUF4369 domain-containing protein n=1 Tax=Chitinophaga agrisoli TaxID=2607653 RepID=A0A5B2VZQ6_9BACT|nr:hypothetical protein [Chitinophaga agrisoli]KAA2243627.1 hypothetical protein F0L74_14180 [Chitinophaga agrisoli]
MKKIVSLFAFSMACCNLYAQQWSGSTTTSNLLYRDGNVLIGATALMGTFGATDRIFQLQGPSGFITFRAPGKTSSFDIAYTPDFGKAGFFTSNMPMAFSTNLVERMRINTDGTVAIGTADAKGYMLAVNGSAVFTKAVVKLNAAWPDYVFNKDYALPSLQMVKAYIDENKRLPDMPSAEEIARTGQDLGEMNKKLLQKIEELTLYVISLKQENEQQQQQLNALQKQIAESRLPGKQ